ncbi:MAG: sucrase ferredoxin [Pyrinomonadaceae bacterium]
MSQSPFFCSELSRAASEKTFGTASVGDVWLLIEYPLGWESQAFEQSLLSLDIKTHLTRLLKTIPRSRLLFIKQASVFDKKISFFVIRTRERDPSVVRFQLDNYDQLLDLDIAAAASGVAPAGGELTNAPLYLVCTHGRRDKCCAKFGFPLYKSLREQLGASVWQSSHVGGDRFAANLVCFPHGLFYAHATEESAREIIKQYTGRRIVPDKYRGRACYANQVQAAEFFIRTEAKLYGLDDMKFSSQERLSETSWRVRFAGRDGEGAHEARVARRLSEFRNFNTCHAVEEKRLPVFVLENYISLDETARE